MLEKKIVQIACQGLASPAILVLFLVFIIILKQSYITGKLEGSYRHSLYNL